MIVSAGSAGSAGPVYSGSGSGSFVGVGDSVGSGEAGGFGGFLSASRRCSRMATQFSASVRSEPTVFSADARSRTLIDVSTSLR